MTLQIKYAKEKIEQAHPLAKKKDGVHVNNLLEVFPFLGRIRNWFRSFATEDTQATVVKEAANDLNQSKDKQIREHLLPK